MAGRQISSTLRNLKFMQRFAAKEDTKKVEEQEQEKGVVTNGSLGTANSVNEKCVVIVEGDPHPGAVKGRMSFQSFNPKIDKLAEEENQSKEPGPGTTKSKKEYSTIGVESMDEDSQPPYNNKEDRKRKQPEANYVEPHHPNKLPNGDQWTRASPGSSKGSNKKREKKTDWSVLRPPKSHSSQG